MASDGLARFTVRFETDAADEAEAPLPSRQQLRR
jgi:hypothetical protein